MVARRCSFFDGARTDAPNGSFPPKDAGAILAAFAEARMRKFVIMGAQGSGKGTQAKLLCDAHDLVHISVGDIFRWHVQKHTKLGAKVKRIVAEDHLVPDELVEEVTSWKEDRSAPHPKRPVRAISARPASWRPRLNFSRGP